MNNMNELNVKFVKDVTDFILHEWSLLKGNITPGVNQYNFSSFTFTVKELTFTLHSLKLDELLSQYIDGFATGSFSIDVRVSNRAVRSPSFFDNMRPAYDVDATIFFYKGEVVEAIFDGLASEDTELPTLLEILRECVRLDTAKPVIKLDKKETDE